MVCCYHFYEYNYCSFWRMQKCQGNLLLYYWIFPHIPDTLFRKTPYCLYLHETRPEYLLCCSIFHWCLLSRSQSPFSVWQLPFLESLELFFYQGKYISRRKSKSMVAISQHIHFIFCSCAPVIFIKMDCMILSHNGYISIPQLIEWVMVDVSHRISDTGANMKSECTLMAYLNIFDISQLIWKFFHVNIWGTQEISYADSYYLLCPWLRFSTLPLMLLFWMYLMSSSQKLWNR